MKPFPQKITFVGNSQSWMTTWLTQKIVAHTSVSKVVAAFHSFQSMGVAQWGARAVVKCTDHLVLCFAKRRQRIVDLTWIFAAHSRAGELHLHQAFDSNPIGCHTENSWRLVARLDSNDPAQRSPLHALNHARHHEVAPEDRGQSGRSRCADALIPDLQDEMNVGWCSI